MWDDETMCTRLTEPLECCGGQRTVVVSDEILDGRTLTLVVVQHELWCSFGPPRGADPFP
jgi:hypothetical protein